ncbi:hypothetical protein [Methylothermus subterraneus]
MPREFLRLAELWRNLNYTPMDSEKFQEYVKQITDLAEASG